MTEDRRDINEARAWNKISSPDIVCFLVPTSPLACDCVDYMALGTKSFSKHVLKRPQGGNQDGQPSDHAIALRLSSQLRDPLKGFKFGRHADHCDIVFAGNRLIKKDPMLSLEHFRIFLDEASGAPVLQDHSAYGTIVDGEHLVPCGDGGPLSRPVEERSGRRTLRDGSVIELKLSPLRTVLTFSVRFPLHRTVEHAELYESNLRAYRKRVAAFAAEKKEFETVVLSKQVCMVAQLAVLIFGLR
ncbi:hypothetical protein PG991_008697 [Apiospora marii]|uniref:FHA domain-containing protein n=1 Tax=Apiospora marii TaxID=335849 RepID=A0ABR1RLF9_9PEZI